jgi:hypothetical protein
MLAASQLSEKSDAILTGQSHTLEVEDDAAVYSFRADERFQLRNVPFANCTCALASRVNLRVGFNWRSRFACY